MTIFYHGGEIKQADIGIIACFPLKHLQTHVDSYFAMVLKQIRLQLGFSFANESRLKLLIFPANTFSVRGLASIQSNFIIKTNPGQRLH